MTCVLVRIQKTWKSCHPKSTWTCYDERSKCFETMEQARAFLKDEYYYCKKRIPCYMDTKSRGTIQCGWIYCFKEKDETGKSHYEQHWVTLYEEDTRVIAVK